MNKNFDKWLTHYQECVPNTWDKLKNNQLDYASLQQWLEFFSEDQNLKSTTKDITILQMISEWLNTGKNINNLRIHDINEFINELSLMNPRQIPKKSLRCTVSNIMADNEMLTAMTSIHLNRATNKIHVNTCHILANATHLHSHILENNLLPIKTQINCEHETRKKMLGLHANHDKKLLSVLEENFSRSSLILFALCI